MSLFRLNLTEYTQALVDYATQINDVQPLVQLRDALFLKINTGDGKTLITTSPIGKTFEWQVTMTNEEQFSAVVSAIKTFNGEAGDSPVTFIDFSRIDTRNPNSLPLDPLLY
jgi:hypothetical protein